MKASIAQGWVAAALTAVLAIASVANAQGQEGQDVPPGDATIRGRLVHPTRPEAIAQVGVLLYALQADGSAGIRRGLTDDEGRFAFSGVSNDPAVLYLLGARPGDVPFGKRFTFPDGALEHELVLELSDPSSDTSVVASGRAKIRLDRGCEDLGVRHSHELENTSQEVVFVAESQRSSAVPMLEIAIPPDAVGFESLLGHEGIERDGNIVRFWGPLYPGRQEIEWSYGIPLEPALERLPIGFPHGADAVEVLARADVTSVSGAGLAPAPAVTGPEGEYASWRRGPVEAGDTLTLQLALGAPTTAAYQLTQAQLWLELDDAALEVNQQVELQVDGAALPASPSAPLLCMHLPPDAAGLRFSNPSLEMGLARDPSGALALHGPIPAGRSTLSLRYRLPADSRGARLDTAFDRELPLLTVLLADTGVVAETSRLHRRRTVRSGERMHLHYEAYALEAGERLELGLERTNVPNLSRRRWAATGFVLVAAAAALGFLIGPLLRGGATRPTSDAPEDREIERDSFAQALTDLDEDLATGKLTPEDHAALRNELRSRAAARLTAQRAPSPAPDASKHKAPFCTACGVQARPGDRFCASCGTALVRSEPAA